MYLAYKIINKQKHYFIRKSVFLDGDYVSRELMELGPDPSAYLVYPGGRSFYIHEQVEETLDSQGFVPDYDLLEKIFWPFVRPDIKRALQGFMFRSDSSGIAAKLTPLEDEFIRNRLHPVDRRRYNYLRMGELDQSRLTSIPTKFYRVLAFKSRDELEHLFMDMENRLEPAELSLYVYSFLYLRRFFTEMIAGRMPQGLDQQKLEKLFIREVCSLNSDDLFWKGGHKPADLHPFLIRYVIMFFDYPLSSESFLSEHLRDFIAGTRQRFRTFPSKKPDFSEDEAGTIMGVPARTLYAMSKKELTRIYRGRIMEMHPDKGGDHDRFIKLMEIYRTLLARKRV